MWRACVCVCACSLCTQQAVPGPLPQRLLSVPEAGSTLHGSGASLCRRRRPQEGRATSRCFSPLPRPESLSASAPAVTPRLSAGHGHHGGGSRQEPPLRDGAAAGDEQRQAEEMSHSWWETGTEGTFCYHLTESVHVFTEEREREKMCMYSFYTSILNADLTSVADTFVAGLHFMFMLTVLKKRKRKDDNVQNHFESFWL